MNYERQLQFHEQEYAEAEARGFPPAQTQYHLDKIDTLRDLMGYGNVIDFAKRLVKHETSVMYYEPGQVISIDERRKYGV